jgi:hypothetical protein
MTIPESTETKLIKYITLWQLDKIYLFVSGRIHLLVYYMLYWYIRPFGTLVVCTGN